MATLWCLCLKRLRTASCISGNEGSLPLWRLEPPQCYIHDTIDHLAPSLCHSGPPHLNRIFTVCVYGGVRAVQHGLASCRRGLGVQHMMKRAMGTTASNSGLSVGDVEESESSGHRKSKYGKSDVESRSVSQSSVDSASSSSRGRISHTDKVHVEWLSGTSSDAVTPPMTRMQGAGDDSTARTAGLGHPLTNTLVSYPLGHLRKHASPVSASESFRYYRPMPRARPSSPDQNQCHVLYDDERSVVGEGRNRPRTRSRARSKQRSEETGPIYIGSDSLLSVSSSSTPTTPQEREEGELSDSSTSVDSAASPEEDDKKGPSYGELIETLQQLPRRWEYTSFGMRHQEVGSKTGGVEFSIMTYNILAQDLLEKHPDLYARSRPQSLNWNVRCQRLLAEIQYHSPDILNMQEVQHDHFHNGLLPVLREKGYRGVYQKRANSSDGCVTLWREDKFHLLRSTPVNYKRGEVLDRDNIALIVELLPSHQGKESENPEKDKIVIANTHLLFNPRRGDVKLAQLMVLMAEIDKCAYIAPAEAGSPARSTHAHLHPTLWEGAGSYCPVVLTGDFNLEPYSELYNFIIKGHLDYGGLLIREMSGQGEGQFGADRFLAQHFFSPTFGITERCQYHREVNGRLRSISGLYTPPSTHPNPSTSSVLDPADHNESVKEEWDSVPLDPTPAPTPLRVNTGSLWHHLNLVSSYRHRIERLDHRTEEVTTHHSRAACTVDYIFYTVKSKEVYNRGDEIRLRRIKDGRLRLIARYGLMSAQELNRLGGIPNNTLASDHVCLLARFLIK